MTPTLPPAPAPAPKSNSNKTVLIIVLVVAGLFLFCICSGIIAAIAIPNFVRFQSKAKQSECRANLMSLYVSQRSYFAEKDNYGDTAEQISFVTSGKTRYTYFGGPELIVGPTSPEASAIEEERLPMLAGEAVPGVEGECPECHFTAACAGDIDSDGTLDVWSVSTQARTHNGQTIEAGTIFHDVDDVAE